jgi:hypothetical protein
VSGVLLPQPVNLRHPLNRSLELWLLGHPRFVSGAAWLDLLGFRTAALTNMDPATDWLPTDRPGGWRHLDFDGANDHGLVSNSTSGALRPAGALTMSCWLKGTNTGATGLTGFGCSGGSGTLGNNLGVDDGDRVGFTVATNSTTAVNAIATGLSLGASWFHVAGVYVPSTAVRVYLNGALANEVTASVPASQYQANGLPFRVGDRGDGSQVFDGGGDDFRLWSRDLSAAEIMAVYLDGLRGYPETLDWAVLPLALGGFQPAWAARSTTVAGVNCHA